MNGQENFRQFRNEVRLEFRGKHQVTVTFVLRGEGGEDPALHPEVSCSHVRAFLGAFEAESDPAEIGCVH